MKLENTTNYNLFIRNDEQRPIDTNHVRRIAESIARYGFLPSKPIQCYRKNGKLVVVDGHHRLEAAKSTDTAVFYVAESNKCQSSMAAENTLVKKWATIDFVRLYASRGVAPYQTLLQYNSRGIPLNMAASMMINNGAGSGNATRKIQDGTFKIKGTELIDKVDAVIQEFESKAPAVKSRSFISAISKCILWDGFNYDMFVRRMRENHLLLEKTSNEDQMLTQIEAIYNYRSRQKFPLKFQIEQAARDRNLIPLKKQKAK